MDAVDKRHVKNTFSLVKISFPEWTESVVAAKEGKFVDSGLRMACIMGVSFHAGSAACVCLCVGKDVFQIYIHAYYALAQRQVMQAGFKLHCVSWHAEQEQQQSGVRIPTLNDSFQDEVVPEATIQVLMVELGKCYQAGDANVLLRL